MSPLPLLSLIIFTPLAGAALLMDLLAVPQMGDPFAIPRPAGGWLDALRQPAPRLRIGFSTAALPSSSVVP